MVATKKMSTNVTDPVADLLTRIRNANIAYKDETLAPVSKQSRAIWISTPLKCGGSISCRNPTFRTAPTAVDR